MDRFLTEKNTGTRPAVKTVYLVRHGQSTHNAQYFATVGADANDARYLDSPLTPVGESQARAISSRVKELNIELVVSSPMTRATQTCMLACAGSGLPLPIVHPLCTERLAYSGDIGSPVSELRRRFPALDYGLLGRNEVWWWSPLEAEQRSQARSVELLNSQPVGSYRVCEPQSDYKQRVNDFRVWLLERPESRIIVFSHGVFLTSLLSDAGGVSSRFAPRFGNAEIRRLKI